MSILQKVVPHAGTWIEILLSGHSGWKKRSFPTRERGLKLTHQMPKQPDIMSFPTRERGLKLYHLDFFFHHLLSFPTRERGLKYCPTGTLIYVDDVVPHAGTWIEIWNMS